MNKFTQGLNDRQYESVTHIDGPLLVFAGAGTGKTRVVTSRIAHIIGSRFAKPDQVLGITFTNKAASEMRERVISMIGNKAKKIQISTFHSFGLKILKEEIETLENYSKNFVIYDSNDQMILVRNIIKDNNYDDFDLDEKLVKAIISKSKSEGIYPNDIEYKVIDPIIYEIFKKYQESLINYNAIDFDDILVLSYKILKDNPEINLKWANKYKYISVDEYQDTSNLQFKFVNLFTLMHKNIMVVGDDDQTIYSWRGARVENINNFKSMYPSVKIIKLEQNYRSTQNILNVANSIIKKNSSRNEKELWSNMAGSLVHLREYYCDEEEAESIFRDIHNYVAREGRGKYSDFAILYRSNFMSRVYEEAARMEGLPYKILGAMKFYDRKEVKLALSYIKILVTKKDVLAYIRTLETPSRGIGAVSIKKVIEFSEARGISFFDALKRVSEITTISSRIQNSILAFVNLINIGKNLFRTNSSWTEAFLEFSDKVGIFRYFREHAKNEKDLQRIEGNYNEFARSLDVFRDREQERGVDYVNLNSFLERITLLSDSDGLDKSKDLVTMMTVHTSKGLEYPNIYLVGLIDGNMPNKRVLEENSQKSLEEERRLMYVAVTRAQRELYLSYFSHRSTKAGEVEMIPSRFLNNLPEDSVDNSLSSLKIDRETSDTYYMQKAMEEMLNNFGKK